MPPLSKKRRGRPKDTKKITFEHLQDIWLQVQVLREQINLKTRRRHTISRASEIIAGRGGLVWIVGGDIEAIAREMAENKNLPVGDWRRVNLEKKGKGFRLRNSKKGRVIVSHKAQHARSIRSRYVQANEIFESNEHVREAWTNYLCDMLGRPRPPKDRNLSRPSLSCPASN